MNKLYYSSKIMVIDLLDPTYRKHIYLTGKIILYNENYYFEGKIQI